MNKKLILAGLIVLAMFVPISSVSAQSCGGPMNIATVSAYGTGTHPHNASICATDAILKCSEEMNGLIAFYSSAWAGICASMCSDMSPDCTGYLTVNEQACQVTSTTYACETYTCEAKGTFDLICNCIGEEEEEEN